jgi:rubredoxin
MQHRKSSDERRECGICWTVYDPAQGDPVGQVLPGTPFEALPEHWSCPHCEAPKSKFMVLSDG